jgi:hypothetical protein
VGVLRVAQVRVVDEYRVWGDQYRRMCLYQEYQEVFDEPDCDDYSLLEECGLGDMGEIWKWVGWDG